MPPANRPLLPALFAIALLVGGLSAGARAGGTLPGPDGEGFVPRGFSDGRALAYLEYATAVQSASILNAIAHMERDLRDPAYQAPSGVIGVADWQERFDKLDTLQDTRDFDGLYLLNALLGYDGHPYVTPAAWAEVEAVLKRFKYWLTDPTPPQPDPALPERDWDESIYWTENHQVLYHTLEYLMGQRYPEDCFTIVGFEPSGDCSADYEMTGEAHRQRARAFLLRWFDERWAIGWAEWHSNIYYQKDATPLLTLIEYADEEDIRTRAAIMLDVLMLDLATHTRLGVLGVTHGRSEMKDTYFGPRNDTWGLVHLLFGQQDEVGYASTGDAGATLFARAQAYRLPHAILEAALSEAPQVDRMRMSVPIDEFAADSPDPEFPPGHPYDLDEPSFTFWWGLGAWTVWQVVPLSLWGADTYALEQTAFFEPFLPLLALLGDPPDIEAGQDLARNQAAILSLGLLKEVNSYTYRDDACLLSTAQDHRKGSNSAQIHTWQATLDPLAMVFTQHPPVTVQPPSEWVGATDGQPGYWTGSASLPRSAQHRNVAIHLYEPQYPQGGLLGAFSYQPFTHAWFPQDYFDEVVQSGSWTFGRAGEGYVALYSWRATEWEAYDSEELALLPESATGPVQQSFDLVAPGGADNVWIVECARAADYASFAAFRAAILATPVSVTDLGGLDGFDVAWTSPSQGALGFGWEAPFTVGGQAVALGDYPRVDNPWVTAEREAPRWLVQGSEAAVELDWAGLERRVVLPAPGEGALGLAALAALALLRCAAPPAPTGCGPRSARGRGRG